MSLEVLDKPLAKYLVVSSFSLGAATLCFLLGGSLANVSGNSDTFLGFSFQASGAIGGFVLIYWLSVNSFRTTWDKQFSPTVNLALKCRGTPRRFSRKESYEARYTLTRGGRGKSAEVEPRWDGSFLVVDLDSVDIEDRIAAEVTNEEGLMWVVSGFYIREPVRDADVKVTVSKWAKSAAESTRDRHFADDPTKRPVANPEAMGLPGEPLEGQVGINKPLSPLKPVEQGARLNMKALRTPSPSRASKNRRDSL